MNTNVLRAIFRRNFVAYFSSPTGYVFIALFMAASSYFAFFSDAFFNANLANLDQLNAKFLWLVLGFAPTITMSIWADERRQGTDELLLTIPANDFEVVLGKYFAALAIYTVSLAFSLLSNWVMLASMGQPDWGLLLANYAGYWFVGVAAIALGMVGSFLTSNLTVSFVLGFLCILPFVVMQGAEQFFADREGVDFAQRWTFVGPFEDFTRGVISLSSIIYFCTVAAFALYLCMILIGRRHWLGGRDGSSMIGHYLVRGVALFAIAASLIFVVSNQNRIRADATRAGLNSLSKDTKDLLASIHVKEAEDLKKRREELTKEAAEAKKAADANKDDKELQKALEKAEQRVRQVGLDESRIKEPILIDAYISREVPKAYATKRLDLISKLREFQNLAGDKLKINIFELDRFSLAADQAKERHGIESRPVRDETRGQLQTENIYLGASVRSGLNEVVIPFFELGVPVEYELIQAIVTVSQSERKTLGIVKTDADLMGGTFSMDGGMPTSSEQQPIVRELKKHYEVIDVDPNQKIVDPSDPNARKYHVLLVAQPSSLTPPQMANVADAVKSGIPTAIFEDPFPIWMRNVPGTDQPKRPKQPMGMMMMPQPPEAKGNLDTLFKELGVQMLTGRFPPEQEDLAAMSRGQSTDKEALVVWQRYNPYPALRFNEGLTNEWVFVNNNAPKSVDKEGKGCFSDDPVTKGLYELLYLFPGSVIERTGRNPALKITPLVQTGEESGTIRYRDIEDAFRKGTPFSMREDEVEENKRYWLAARIEGEIESTTPPPVKTDAAKNGEAKDGEKKPDDAKPAPPKKTKISAIVVSDIDMLHSEFFAIRANPLPGLDLQFQNVPFVLNVIDSLAGDTRFLNIRKGRQLYGHLTQVEEHVEEVVTSRIEEQIDDAEKRFKEIEEKAKKDRENAVAAANKQLEDMKKKGEFNITALQTQEDLVNMSTKMATIQELIEKDRADKEFRRARDKAIEDGKRATFALNDTYKRRATLLPPILPFVMGIIVFFYRRSREQEGVAKSRLR
jgi:ABC-2 type transport system permease protein